MKKLTILLLAFALFGCTADRVVESTTTTRTYTLVGKNPPKHFYVDLLDNETGQVYQHVYVSKHCHSHEKSAVIGNKFSLTSEHKVYESGETRYRFVNLYSAFCH